MHMPAKPPIRGLYVVCGACVCPDIYISGEAQTRRTAAAAGHTPALTRLTAQTAARLTGPERGRDRLDRRATRRARGYAATAALAALPDAPRAPARAARLCGRDPRRRVFN